MSDPDWLSEAGARELARRITYYWLQRGCAPTVKVKRMTAALNTNDHDRPFYVVRSDLGVELPKQHLKSAAA